MILSATIHDGYGYNDVPVSTKYTFYAVPHPEGVTVIVGKTIGVLDHEKGWLVVSL